MKKKDLLIVFNIFGISNDEEHQIKNYIFNLRSLFFALQEEGLTDSVRVVVSSVLNSEECLYSLKKEFKEKIYFFIYNTRIPCQVSFNKTVLSSIQTFDEEYEGYFYLSSGIDICSELNIFKRIIEKNNSGDYGIIQLQIDLDNGYEWLGKLQKFSEIDFSKDYNIPIGNNCNFHAACINKEIKNFYGIPLSDVHGTCCFESCLSYVAYAVRKKYILLGNSECFHHPQFDNEIKMKNLASHPKPPCGLMWGRTKKHFLNDAEGIDSGIGYYAGINTPIDWNGSVLPYKREKYDENYLSNDERLKFSVKRNYFTNSSELDYNSINFTFKE